MHPDLDSSNGLKFELISEIAMNWGFRRCAQI